MLQHLNHCHSPSLDSLQSMSCFYWVVQHWTQHHRGGLTSTEQMGKISSTNWQSFAGQENHSPLSHKGTLLPQGQLGVHQVPRFFPKELRAFTFFSSVAEQIFRLFSSSSGVIRSKQPIHERTSSWRVSFQVISSWVHLLITQRSRLSWRQAAGSWHTLTAGHPT